MGGGAPADDSYGGGYSAPQQQRPQAGGASRPAQAQRPAPSFSDMDDDIPF
jgi:single-strand DNA-binding protein